MEIYANRTIDDLGRVVLPKEFRSKYGWGEGATVAIYQANGVLIMELAKNSPRCTSCGTPEGNAQDGNSDDDVSEIG